MTTKKKTTEVEPFGVRMNRMLTEIGTVSKTRNQGLKYNFLSYDDMATAVRDAAARCGLYLTTKHLQPPEKDTIEMRNGGVHRAYLVHMQFTYNDMHSDASASFEDYGEGADAYDKALNKAETSAWKNAHRFGFLVATGDKHSDSETDQTSEASSWGRSAPGPSSRQEPGPSPAAKELTKAREAAGVTIDEVAAVLFVSPEDAARAESATHLRAETVSNFMNAIEVARRAKESQGAQQEMEV